MTRKIKVTHVVRQYLPSVGGLEEVVRNIALHQYSTGKQDVQIITLNRLFRNNTQELPRHEVIEGISVTRLPYRGSSRYPICPSVLQELKDTDVVHVHGVDFFYDFLALTRWLHRKPLVLSTHGGFFHTGFASTAKQIYFKTISRLSGLAYDRVVATSGNDGDLFSKIIPSRKLEVIENGVNVAKYSNHAATEPTPTLIYFGRWSANKGLHETIDLFAALQQRHPEWRLIIAGREYDHTLGELSARIDALGITSYVQLVASPSDEEIQQLITQSSYFICLSHHEGFGIAPIEGMSAGLIPILSDIPPFRRLIEQSALGFTISPTWDNNTVIEKIVGLHQQSVTSYCERRTHAVSFAQNYAWPKIAERYLAIYEQLGSR